MLVLILLGLVSQLKYSSVAIHLDLLCYSSMSSYYFFLATMCLLLVGDLYGSPLIAINSANTDQCPPWTTFNDTLMECECNSHILNEIVQCSDHGQSIFIRVCNCMSFHEDINTVLVGSCSFTCHLDYSDSHHISINYRITAAGNATLLNSELCGQYNRRGFMCGQCLEGFAPPVYSYSLECVNCTEYRYNWLKYLGVAFLPQTILFFILITLSVSVTSGEMVAYVAISQMVTTPALVQFYLGNSINHLESVKWIVALNSMWNLDLFRSVYPPFCLHPNLSPLSVISLDYIVGVYPLLLILLTYVVIKIHDRSVVCVWVCKPTTKVLSLFRRKWNIHTSLVKGFASFLLLSYVKLLNVSFLLLTPSGPLHSLNGTQFSRYLRSDGTVPYLRSGHVPYVVGAVIMFAVFNVFPLVLLFLYPCQCTQRCLNCCHLHHPAVHTFMDTFQGCYRHRPRDYRHFAAVYLLLRVFNLVIYFFNGDLIYFWGASAMFLFMAIVVAFFKPYNSSFYSAIDVGLLVLVALAGFMLSYSIEGIFIDPVTFLNNKDNVPVAFLICITVIFPLYGVMLIARPLLPSTVLQKLKLLYQKMRSHNVYDTMSEMPYRTA